MSIEATLKEIADELGKQSEQKIATLNRKKTELEAELDKLHSKIKDLAGAPQRAAEFEAKIGNDSQCPYCSVERGVSSPLNPIGHPPGEEDSDTDLFRCRSCGCDIEVRDQS